jgi:beta-lactamase class D/beta-lactamase class D OXA-1
VALSLMVFDQKLITQKTVFKWDGENRGLALWNQNQTPYTWLKNSVVWVSQELTPQLGMSKIKWYLARFYYGNQDFSGDPGKYNGLTHAWLSSSLKISANEQLHFLKLLATNRLPVSLKAMGNTKTNMYLETSSNGWKLYGKTGAGDWVCRKDGVHNKSQDGWFIGYVKKKETIYLFVANITNFQKHEVAESDGTEVKNITKTILAQKGLF